MSINNLSIPIYLNQRIVFDMLATIEDGFSQLSNIKTSYSDTSNKSGQVGTEIGTSNMFALLGVKLNGSFRGEKSKNEQGTVSQDKVHTPSSLFSKLYEELEKEELIKRLDTSSDINKVGPGDFIEVRGQFSKNPLIDLMDSFYMLGELATAFDEDKSNNPKANKNKALENKKLLGQIKALSDSLKNGNMMDLICTMNGNVNLKAVLPVYIDYFVNNNMNEIIDGEYKVLGKVTKVITTESSESINLLRNTSFSLLQTSMISQLTNSFNSGQNLGLQYQEIITEISGPAVQLIPISIFV
jgi:hypothetical protein